MSFEKKKPAALHVSATPQNPQLDAHLSIEQTSDRVNLSLRSGAKATILLYGATVISWTLNSRELLFLSEKAILDGSKPVRGGIPLVFPVFGPPAAGTAVEKLPQHGFARSSRWELLGRTEENDESIRVDFGLGSEGLDEEVRKKWPYTFGLIYSVTLTKDSLETKMVVQNSGEEPFEFNVLFHTYLRVPDISSTTVSGLKGLTYTDKILKGSSHTEENEDLKIASQVDRVYKSVPGDLVVKNNGTPLFTVTKSGLEDTVIWNPYESAASMADFAPSDGYKNMICVEAGSVAEFQNLEAGSAWEGGVVYKANL